VHLYKVLLAHTVAITEEHLEFILSCFLYLQLIDLRQPIILQIRHIHLVNKAIICFEVDKAHKHLNSLHIVIISLLGFLLPNRCPVKSVNIYLELNEVLVTMCAICIDLLHREFIPFISIL